MYWVLCHQTSGFIYRKWQKSNIFIEEFKVDVSLMKKGSTNLKEYNSLFEDFEKKQSLLIQHIKKVKIFNIYLN